MTDYLTNEYTEVEEDGFSDSYYYKVGGLDDADEIVQNIALLCQMYYTQNYPFNRFYEPHPYQCLSDVLPDYWDKNLEYYLRFTHSEFSTIRNLLQE